MTKSAHKFVSSTGPISKRLSGVRIQVKLITQSKSLKKANFFVQRTEAGTELIELQEMRSADQEARRQVFEALLTQARIAHESSAELGEFAKWPRDLKYVDIAPALVPATRQMSLWQPESALHSAIQAVVPYADWKQTYTEEEVGFGFLQDYGYLELYGPYGHFYSKTARAFIAYWGQGLYYPAHHHAAEELYFIVSGSATFDAEGLETVRLMPGQTRHHKPNQLHSMTTKDSPVLTYILWKGDGIDGLPVIDKS